MILVSLCKVAHKSGFDVILIGSSYPRALGHNDGNEGNNKVMPVEGDPLSLFAEFSSHISSESGNMLIMTLSYAQKTGDNSQLRQYVIDFYLGYDFPQNSRLVRLPYLISGLST